VYRKPGPTATAAVVTKGADESIDVNCGACLHDRHMISLVLDPSRVRHGPDRYLTILEVTVVHDYRGLYIEIFFLANVPNNCVISGATSVKYRLDRTVSVVVSI
jgi:hypothetical protein